MSEGSLEVKLPTIWADEKQRWAEAERREEQKREDQRRERVRSKKIQVREKVEKLRNTVFFQWFVAPEGRKVGSLKRQVRSHLARWEMKKCTPLWREANFEVKMYKSHQGRTTFGSCDVEKAHAVVARSTFRSQNAQNTQCSDHFWKLRCDLVSRGRRKGLCTFSSVSKTWGFCSISKNDGRRGTFEEDLQRTVLCGNCSTKDMFMRDVRRSGRWFPERGCIWEHQICRFAKMILRDRCSTSFDLASIFRGRRSTLERWSGKIAKRIGTRLSALHSTFHFWRKCRRIALFLMLSSVKNEEASQNCFVFNVVKFKNEGSLAELFRFWCGKLKKEEVSQNCFLFDVVNFTKGGSLAEVLRFWCCQLGKMKKSRRIAW